MENSRPLHKPQIFVGLLFVFNVANRQNWEHDPDETETGFCSNQITGFRRTDGQKESFIHHSRGNKKKVCKNEFNNNKNKINQILPLSSISERSGLHLNNKCLWGFSFFFFFFDLLTFPFLMDVEEPLRN